MNYKNECLKIIPDLRIRKVKGCAFYHVVNGHKHIYSPHSSYQDTTSMAWKDCYERLKAKQSAMVID